MPQLNSRELLERARQAQSPAAPVSAAEPRQNELSAEALLIAGRAEYQQGHLDRAAEFLGLAVRANPDSAEAQHLLGNAQQDLGRLDSAIACYRHALRLEPQRSAAENDLGTALFAKELHREAADAFRRCVALDPSNHRAYENLGSALRKLGHFRPARSAFQRAFWIRLTQPLRNLFGNNAAIKPDRGEQLVREAYEAYLAGRFEEAERLCARRLDQVPDDSKALHVRALSLNKREQYLIALPILEALVRRAPSSVEYHDALGSCLRGLRRYDASLASFNRALALDPRSAVTHNNVSALMNDRSMHAQAETAARAALLIEPQSSAAMINLGVALRAQGRLDEAEAELRKAIGVNPRSVKGRLQLAEVLRNQDRPAEARSELDKVREADSGNADRYLHLGLLAQEFEHDTTAALDHFRRAQALAPDKAGPFVNEALLHMMKGDFSRNAWELYEWRKKAPDRADSYRKVVLEEWNGAKVGAGELLVYGEQGLGDEIMFASMLPQALGVAPRLRFAAQPRLCSLFARSFPEMDVFAWDRATGSPSTGTAKFAIAIGSLGRYFRTSQRDFPRNVAYLSPDPLRVEAMRTRLDAFGPGRKIGIAWRGGVPLTRQARRSLQLEAFGPVLRRPGFRWINLQHGNVDEELAGVLAATGVPIERLHDATDDFEDAAALTSALDLVVSVCSTTVHLAGAVGQAVWVMAPFAAEWRYGMSGSRMLWYPSAEIFRQPRPGDWASVISQIGARLDAL